MKRIIEVNIRITSVIEDIDSTGMTVGDAERTENSVEGFLHLYDGGALLTYSEESEGGRTDSEIELTENDVRVRRKGAIESELVFSEGGAHTSIYKIPPYAFEATVTTKKIRRNLTEDGGRIDLFYVMSIGGADRSARMNVWISKNSSNA